MNPKSCGGKKPLHGLEALALFFIILFCNRKLLYAYMEKIFS